METDAVESQTGVDMPVKQQETNMDKSETTPVKIPEMDKPVAQSENKPLAQPAETDDSTVSDGYYTAGDQ